MSMKVGSGKPKNGTYVHRVIFDDRVFENVENIPSCTGDKCRKKNCKYYSDCWYNEGVVRTFDCKRNAKKVTKLYSLITSVFAVMLFYNIFYTQKMGFFKGMGMLILGLVALDVICTFIEWLVPKIRDKRFYKKLVKLEAENTEKEQKEKEIAEAKRIESEKRKMEAFPYYKEILKAESFVNDLVSLSDEYDFGPNEDKVSECVNTLSEIISALKEEPASYSNVAFLFEGLIEEFYKTLKFYSSFLKAGISEKKDEEILGSCVDKFLMHLGSSNVETVLDEDSTRLQFRNSAQSVIDLLHKKGED